jgi:hypothetical protein
MPSAEHEMVADAVRYEPVSPCIFENAGRLCRNAGRAPSISVQKRLDFNNLNVFSLLQEQRGYLSLQGDQPTVRSNFLTMFSEGTTRSSQTAFILELDSYIVQGMFEALANLFDLRRLYHQWRSEHQPIADYS